MEFEFLGENKILINTSLGLPFDTDAFEEWIRKDSNFAIFDGDGKKELTTEVESRKNIITSKKSAGWSAETHQRLSEKVIENVKQYMEDQGDLNA